MHKPCSEACVRNTPPLIEVLRDRLAPGSRVLEIGSGTGQHAVALAEALAVNWQPTDLAQNLPGIQAWIDDGASDRVRPPLALDVDQPDDWPEGPYDAGFSANTAHIMAWASVQALFRGMARSLRPGGCFWLYGPFNRDGRFTSEGNRRLDAWARTTFPGGGIRDLEAVIELGVAMDWTECSVQPMPANNLLLTFGGKEPLEGSADERGERILTRGTK